jgi:serine/threonine protein kinase
LNIPGYSIGRKVAENSIEACYEIAKNQGNSKDELMLKVVKIDQIPPSYHEEIENRLHREFRCGKTQSNHVFRSYEYGKVGRNPFIIIDDFLKRNFSQNLGNPMNIGQLNSLAKQVLTGLKDIHELDIIHRNLNPEALFYSADGRVRLVDFSIAGLEHSHLTQVSDFDILKKIVRNKPYQAPEHFNSKFPLDITKPTTDLFAFGVLFYQILTGQYPFGAWSEKSGYEQYMKNLASGKYEDPINHFPATPDYWLAIFEKTLHPNYKKRFSSAIEILSLLPDNQTESAPSNAFGLKFVGGEEIGRLVDLEKLASASKKNRLLIGYDEDSQNPANDISLKEYLTSYVSRKHATLSFDADQQLWRIHDGQEWEDHSGILQYKSSTNGTYLDGQLVSKEGRALQAGNQIQIGSATMVFDLINRQPT